MNRKNAWAFLALATIAGCPLLQAADSLKGSVDIGASKPPMLSSTTDKTLGDFRFAIADMAEKVLPAVVSIQTESVARNQQSQDPFEFFFGPGMNPWGAPQGQARPQPKQQGLGSGVIVSSQGYILTNNHVVENADNITVTLVDKREFKAKIVGTDPQTDIAVIQLDKPPKDLPLAYLGKSETLRVGEWVVAIGSPFGLASTVTSGIVSAKGVHNRGITGYENFIQTDAAINPGNSGGGLFNLSGELIGINTAILSRSGGFQGIGFAIPIDLARGILQDLVQSGKVTRGWLGVSIQDVDPKIAKAMKLDKVTGALIAEVIEGGPAEKAGVLAGDLVTALNGAQVKDANALRNAVAIVKPGETAELSLLRNGKPIKLKVQVALRDGSGEFSSTQGGGSESKELGLEVGAMQEGGGVQILSVTAKGLAEESGLMKGDVILQVNQKPIKGLADFQAAIRAEAKAKTLLFLIRRGNGRLFAVIEKP